MPPICRRSPKIGASPSNPLRQISFTWTSRYWIDPLALCLSQMHSASVAASMDVYRLVARLTKGDPTVKCAWLNAANSSPVYRLFRSTEVWTTGERLYLGTDELRKDFGDQMY